MTSMAFDNCESEYNYILNGDFRSIIDNNSDTIKEKYNLDEDYNPDTNDTRDSYYELCVATVIVENEDKTKNTIYRYSVVAVDGNRRKVMHFSKFLHKSGIAYTCSKLKQRKLPICKRITNYICDREKLGTRIKTFLICYVVCIAIIFMAFMLNRGLQ